MIERLKKHWKKLTAGVGLPVLLISACLLGVFPGCTSLDGQKVPDYQLIESLSSVSSLVIASQFEFSKEEKEELLIHIKRAKMLISSREEGQPIDVGVIQAYIQSDVPNKYKPLAALILSLIQNRVEPVLNSRISEEEKAQQIVESIESILSGVETGLQSSST